MTVLFEPISAQSAKCIICAKKVTKQPLAIDYWPGKKNGYGGKDWPPEIEIRTYQRAFPENSQVRTRYAHFDCLWDISLSITLEVWNKYHDDK